MERLYVLIFLIKKEQSEKLVSNDFRGFY